MKFSQNTRVVSPNTINARYTAVDNPMAYGQNGKEWDAFGSALGVGLKTAQKEQDDADAADVLEAKNKIQTALNGAFYGEDGIFTTGVGENAKGMGDRAAQATQTTFDDVAKDYNPRVQRALRQNMGDTLLTYQKTAIKQEQDERKKQAQADYTSVNEDAINKAAQGQNYMDDNILNLNMNEIKRNTLAYGKMQGWDGKQYTSMIRDGATKLYGTAINAAIADNDMTRAQAILSQHAKEMDQQTVIQLNQKLNADKNMHEMKNDAKWILDNSPEGKNPDGTYNIAYYRNYARNEWANATEDVTVTEPGGAGNWFNDSETNEYIAKYSAQYGVDPNDIAALASIESGGDQNADSGLAHGVMQLTPETAKSLGVDINDKAGNIEGGVKYYAQLLQKYKGNKDLAVAAYNAGENAVDTYGGIPPYKETQNHVKKFHTALDEMNQKAAPDIPAERNYTVTGLVSDTGLSDLTEKKLRLFSRDYYNEFHEMPQVTSMRRHGDGSSWHDSGQAFDISGGAMDNHDNRQKALEIGKKYGLVGLDEYEHPASTTTGPNVHFSDHGDEIPAGAGGSTTRTIKRKKHSEQQAQDFENLLVAEATQRNQQIKEQQQQQQQDDANKILGMGASDAYQYVQNIKAAGNYARWESAERVLRNAHPELFAKPASSGGSRSSSRNNGNNGGYIGKKTGIHYSQNQYYKAISTFNRWDSGSEDISQKEADNAAFIINDIEGKGSDNLDSPKAFTVAADELESAGGDKDKAKEALMEKYDFSDPEADYYLKNIDE